MPIRLDRAVVLATARRLRSQALRLRRSIAISLAFVLLPVLFFWRITLAGEVVYWGTPLLQFFPWRGLAVEQYQSGQLPLWNPYVDFGAPLAANLQTAAFSPLNFFYLMMPVEQAMGYTIVLSVALAGIAMYGCALAFGIGSWGAMLAALAYMFSGYLISRAGFLSMTATIPWFPVVMAATELTLVAAGRDRALSPFDSAQGKRVSSARGQRVGSGLGERVGPALGLAITIGLLLLAGHIQLAFYVLLAATAYAVFRAIQLARAESSTREAVVGANLVFARSAVSRRTQEPAPSANSGQALSKSKGSPLRFGQWGGHRAAAIVRTSTISLLPVAGAIVLGIGFSAIQLVPTAELTLHAARQAGPAYDLAMNYSWWPGQVVQLVAPDFFGNPATGNYRGPVNYWEGISYIGVPALLLALFAARHSRHPARPYLLALTAVAFVFALGRFTPVYPWVFDHMPGFGLFQAPARFLLWSTFAGALLAGMGLDALAEPVAPVLRRWTAVTLAGSGGLGVGAAAALAVMGSDTVAGASLQSVARAAALLCATAVILRFAQRPVRPWWPAAACVLLAADLFSYGVALTPTTSPLLYRVPWPPQVQELQADAGLDRRYTAERDFDRRFGEALSFKDYGSTSWEDLMVLRTTLLPNLGQAARAHEVFNYDPLKLERSRLLRELADTAADPSPLLSVMGVRWVADRDGRFRRTTAEPMPRAFRIDASGAVPAAGRQSALSLLQAGAVDLQRQVVLEQDRAGVGAELPPPPYLPATVMSYDAQRVVVETAGDRPGVLVLTDSFYPGWQATLDGQQVTVYAANVAFRGVLVPAGPHTVVFEYRPASVTLGLGLSALSLVVALGLGGFALQRRRERSADSG